MASVTVPMPSAEHTRAQSPRTRSIKAFKACMLHLSEEVPPGKDPRQIIQDFRSSINMSAQEIEDFLESEESRHAAAIGEEADLQGRHIARRIIELLSKDDGTGETYYEGDYTHMHQVTTYLRCHKALLEEVARSEDERKSSELSTTVRYHMMNFGYDPLKEAAKL